MTQKITPQDHPDFVGGWVWTAMEIQWIEERITEAVAKEREACAKVCDDKLKEWRIFYYDVGDVSKTIRERGQE